MTQTQTESSNNPKQVLSNPGVEEKPSEPQPPVQKPQVPKPVRILAAIALLAGVGYGVYRLFFYQPEPEGLF